MDPRRFDSLVRAFGTESSRRRLVSVLSALPLVSILTGLPADEAAAEKPHERLRRHKAQRRRKQRHRKRQNKNNDKGNGNRGNGNNAGGGLGGPQQCTANGDACQKNSDCCKGNCFNQVCSNTPNQCGGTNCPADATGCCAGNCCASPANQCNPQGECCAPNCGGKQCGPDGCGGNGVCGRCPQNSVCDESTGHCSCGPENCDGCCDENDVCQPGNRKQQCGGGGIACYACSQFQYCSTETGTCRDNPPCGPATCPNGCCFEQENGLHVCRTDLRGCTAGGACCDGCCDGSGACLSGKDDGACGIDGSACIACDPLGGLCDQGRCQCDATNCPDGCCSDGPGNPGLCFVDDPRFCAGTGGRLCATCPDGTTCDAQTGQCIPICSAETCPEGCCDANHQCQQGKSNTACGTRGVACEVCDGSNGACVDQRCQCTADTCPTGCCENGPGKPGLCFVPSNDTCGIGGQRCVRCSESTACNEQGICRCATASCCSLDSCPNGCCENGPEKLGRCLTGTTSEACGAQGGICVACAEGTSCCPGRESCGKLEGEACSENRACCSDVCNRQGVCQCSAICSEEPGQCCATGCCLDRVEPGQTFCRHEFGICCSAAEGGGQCATNYPYCCPPNSTEPRYHCSQTPCDRPSNAIDRSGAVLITAARRSNERSVA